jgi:hypothetical protein
MNKTAFLGLVLLGGVGYCVASCSSDTKSNNNNNAATGGETSIGGTVSTGGTTSPTTGATGGSTSAPNPYCDGANLQPERFDGGLVQMGGTDPVNSIPLDVGGFYAQSDEYKGYCFTYADGKTDGSTIFPPCGGNGNECFTKDTKLCVTAALGVASSSVWGAGIGCSLNEDKETGKAGDPVSLVGKTSVSVEVYGCNVPSKLRLQINVDPPDYNADTDKLMSGYFCQDVTLSEPDANGARKGTVQISDLQEDCWDKTNRKVDTSKHTAKSIQLQVNAETSKKNYDFCVSKFELK